MAKVEIVPAILADSMEVYNRLLEQTARFAKRVSIDFCDGEFTPNRTINLIQAHWPAGLTVDWHLMYERPTEQLETIVSAKPNLAVIHAEAQGDLAGLLTALQAVGIKAGVALLPPTDPVTVAGLVERADQVLIFGGQLGSYGGQLETSCLPKIAAVKTINPRAEVCWDGGVNHDNLKQVVLAGADVVNSGGYIQNADEPEAAYKRLMQIAATAAEGSGE